VIFSCRVSLRGISPALPVLRRYQGAHCILAPRSKQ
jgi:hypothetical protein